MTPQSNKDTTMIPYRVYATNMLTGEEFDFDIEAESRDQVLAMCEEDFNDTIQIDLIMDKR
jgi:hypothetical protein